MDNDEMQERIIHAPDENLLVLAGPGSGKTETLARRVRHLIARGRSVLATTFTKKAACELKERIGMEHPLLTVSTEHAFCHKILRQQGRIHMIDPGAKLRFFGNSKSLMLAVDKARLGFEASSGILKVARSYAEWLERRNMLDFDDLLSKAHDQLGAPMFDHVIVDEAQDNNQLQYDLLPLLGRYLTLIGDLDQSIYGFRGAAPHLIQQFSSDYAPTVHFLENNYRCAPEICHLAQGIIEHDAKRFKKRTLPKRQTKGVIKWRDSQSASDEISWLLDRVAQGGDFTLLARSNALLAEMEERLALDLWPCDRKGGLWRREGLMALRRHLLAPCASTWERHWQSYLDDLPLGAQWERILGLRLAALPEEDREGIATRFQTAGPHLSTIHGAKGLEWPSVVVAGLRVEEFPRKSEPLDEERRLLYVALTRAKDYLTLIGDEASPFGKLVLEEMLKGHCSLLASSA